jgi:large subunit ribosomal protein L6
MSRIGRRPIPVPAGLEVEIGAQTVEVRGPKGTVSIPYDPAAVRIVKEGANLQVLPVRADDATLRAKWGTTSRLLANAFEGVTKSFTRELHLVGVGYRVQAAGQKLTLSLGFSHPVSYEVPKDVKVEVIDQTKIRLSSARKDLLGQVAAEIRSFRPPEPYKGKGIRYADETIRRKAGKSAAATK